MDWPVFAELLIIGATGVGALIAGFLFFILKGISNKQNTQHNLSNKIWSWARSAVGGLKQDIVADRDLHDKELRDIRRWVRHRERTMYTEMLELAKLIGHPADDVAQSIRKTLEQDRD